MWLPFQKLQLQETQDHLDHPDLLVSPAKMALQDQKDQKDHLDQMGHLALMVSLDRQDHQASQEHKARRVSVRNIVPLMAAYSSRMVLDVNICKSTKLLKISLANFISVFSMVFEFSPTINLNIHFSSFFLLTDKEVP